MSIREEEYLLTAARCGNIKSAAEELNITPPALSIFIGNLEKNVGTPLFHRVGKQFVPTEAGNLYISYAENVIKCKRELDARLNDIKNGVTGKISFGLHPRRTTYILPRALKMLAGSYPNVDTRIVENSSQPLYDKLLRGELDFIIITRTIKNSALEYYKFYDDKLVGVLSPEHTKAGFGKSINGSALKWLDLKLLDGECFILQYPNQSTRMYTDMAIKHSGARPGKVIYIENLETASQMAAESLGIAFNMYSFTKNFLYPKPVRYYLVGDKNLTITYYIVKRKDRYLPNYARFLIDALKQAAAETG